METAIVTKLDIESYAVTDRGLSEKRPENEDSFLESVNLGLFAVADGVGGAQAGEIASQMAVETLFQSFSVSQPDADDATILASSFDRANDAIFNMAQELPQLSRMATTIVALKLTSGTATIGHVGDSRIYRYGANGELRQITEDHSLVGEEIRAGRLTPDEAENHPAKNVISRALGAESTVEPEFAVLATEPGDIFLLCSDGITRHVSDAEIRGALATCLSPESACHYLKDLCFERGAEDNLTAVIVRVSGERQSGQSDENTSSTYTFVSDEEPTVSLSRPFTPDDDDDLLELGTAPTNSDMHRAGELELFETVQNIPDIEQARQTDGIGDTGSLGETIHETDGMTSAETLRFSSDELQAAQDRNGVQDAVVADEPNLSSVAIEPALDVAPPMFGSSYSATSVTDDGGKGYSTVLFAIGCILIGGLIGILAYHYGFGGNAEPVPPPVVEMKSDNIPFSAFEKNRRNVDADPAAFLKEFPEPKDAEDHILIARAAALTGDVPRAKASLAEAIAKVDSVDSVNQKTVKTEIAFLQTIVNDPNALKRFQAEINKPAG